SPKTWGIEAHAYLHLLNTKDLQEGQVSGVVVEGGELGYQGVGYIDYRFSQDKINILKQEIEAPVGKAALADLHLAWQYQQFSAKLHLEDLPLYYRWHGLGHKQGKVSTSLLGSSSAT